MCVCVYVCMCAIPFYTSILQGVVKGFLRVDEVIDG